MSLTNQAYDIIGEWFDSHEGELLAALQEKWPHEYDQAIVTQKNEDPSLLDSPLVYEFELPFLKTTPGNPEALQRTLFDLQESFTKEKKLQ